MFVKILRRRLNSKGSMENFRLLTAASSIPEGMHINSTDYEPHRDWGAGCQGVATNWQTFGENEIEIGLN